MSALYTHRARRSQASPALEAFGNAKTIRNANSSRFGKLTWLLFSPSATLKGLRVQTSLLEKARLCAQPSGERSFHIFYQMTRGLGPTADGQRLGLRPAEEYAALRHGGCTTIEGVDDAARFSTLVHALRTLGFAAATLEQLWSLLCGLLLLGSVTFTATRDDAAEVFISLRKPLLL